MILADTGAWVLLAPILLAVVILLAIRRFVDFESTLEQRKIHLERDDRFDPLLPD